MIGFWFLIIGGIVIALGFGVAWLVYGVGENSVGHIFGSIITTLAFIALVWFGGQAWKDNTQSGQRMVKSWESETQSGIDRTVTVYDIQGDVLQTYSGRFDVIDDDKSIIFDDQHGKRHIIYNPTGTVIIDER